MNSRIKEILIPLELADDYKGAAPFNSLFGISRLNAFVGPNNSGKSRLLRALFRRTDNPLSISTDTTKEEIVRTSIRSLLSTLDKLPGHVELSTKTKELVVDPWAVFYSCHGWPSEQEKKQS